MHERKILANQTRDEANAKVRLTTDLNAGLDKVGYVGAMVVCLACEGMADEEHDLVFELITRLGGEVVTDFNGPTPECVVTQIARNEVSEDLPTAVLIARAGCVAIVGVDWVIQSYLNGIWFPFRPFEMAHLSRLSTRVFENITVTIIAPVSTTKRSRETSRRPFFSVITTELISGLRVAGAVVHSDENYDVRKFERLGSGKVCVYLVEQIREKSRKRPPSLESQWRWADSNENVKQIVVANASWAWRSIRSGKLFEVDDEIRNVANTR